MCTYKISQREGISELEITPSVELKASRTSPRQSGQTLQSIKAEKMPNKLEEAMANVKNRKQEINGRFYKEN